MQNIRKQTSRGFTLIELLIVIAIIALLAAILFPVFARVRENARRSSCASNMKQIGLGILQYSQDYDERLPNYVYPEGANPFWYEVTDPYIKSKKIFRCPSQAKTTNPFANLHYSSYGMIGRDDWTSDATPGNETHIYDHDGTHLSKVIAPSITYMVVESQRLANSITSTTGPDDGYYLAALTTDYGSTITSSAAKGVRTAHFAGYNVAFADGHIKWVKLGTEQNYAVSLQQCLTDANCLSGKPAPAATPTPTPTPEGNVTIGTLTYDAATETAKVTVTSSGLTYTPQVNIYVQTESQGAAPAPTDGTTAFSATNLAKNQNGDEHTAFYRPAQKAYIFARVLYKKNGDVTPYYKYSNVVTVDLPPAVPITASVTPVSGGAFTVGQQFTVTYNIPQGVTGAKIQLFRTTTSATTNTPPSSTVTGFTMSNQVAVTPTGQNAQITLTSTFNSATNSNAWIKVRVTYTASNGRTTSPSPFDTNWVGPFK